MKSTKGNPVQIKLTSYLCGVVLALLPIFSNGVENTSLSPTVDHLRATQRITDFLERYHYRKIELDDQFSATIYEKFLETLDPTKSYFLASDIKYFDQYKYALDDALKSNNLVAPFSFFSIYRDRIKERINYALQLIENDFDFDIEEAFLIDRENASWPETIAEQNDLWRKRIKNDVLSLRLANKDMQEIKSTLTKRYEGIRKRNDQLDSDDVFQLYINAYATSIDPHTSYLSPRTFDNFSIRMSLSLEGIGALLRADGDYTLVERIIPGGPAEESGLLHAKDRIVGIAQEGDKIFTDVIGWRLDEVVELIRGPKDTVVRLQILPGDKGEVGGVEEISITRNKIKLEEQAASRDVIELPRGNTVEKVGIITIPTFYLDFTAFQDGDKDYRSTTRDVSKLLEELQEQEITSLVLDLRSNGGGSLVEATKLAGLFINKGPIVQVRDSSGHIEIHRDKNKNIAYDGPLVVLVDRFSASASEIVASALQDYGRAVIVGETTFGKGSVQQLIDLNRFGRKSETKLGQLKATIAQYFRVTGGSTQHKGVEPDIAFEAIYNKFDQGERSLEHALPWSQISPADFNKKITPAYVIEDLHRRHNQRVANDEKYQSLVQLFNLNEELQNQDTVSLNEATRKQLFSAIEDKRKKYQEIIGLPEADEDDISIPDPADKNIEQDILLLEAAHISADLKNHWNSSTLGMIVQH
jgi:carboxyl-terminal processing protease